MRQMMEEDNQETINERVRKIRKALDMTQVEFAKKLGIHGGSLSTIELGGSLTEQNIKLICIANQLKEGYTVNENWLRNGGDISLMFKTQNPFPVKEKYAKLLPDERKFMETYEQLYPETKEKVLSFAVEKLELQELRKMTIEREASPLVQPMSTDDPAPPYMAADINEPLVKLPFYGSVAAGEPIDINIDPEDYLHVSRQAIPGDPEDYFALRIRGYSMTEAGIINGDIALIHKAEELISGQIQLVRYQDSSTLKRVIRRNGMVYLRWEDGSGREIEVDSEADSEEYQIQGIFVKVLSSAEA